MYFIQKAGSGKESILSWSEDLEIFWQEGAQESREESDIDQYSTIQS